MCVFAATAAAAADAEYVYRYIVANNIVFPVFLLIFSMDESFGIYAMTTHMRTHMNL